MLGFRARLLHWNKVPLGGEGGCMSIYCVSKELIDGSFSVSLVSPMDCPGRATPNINDGIYVLRTTQQNQVQLNLMADQKANIIIGVTMIFFTLESKVVSGDGSWRAAAFPWPSLD